METRSSHSMERWIYPLLLLAAFIFALVGMNPTFYADDSPETVTACVTLGIPHPPGYPLHTLIGHFFSWLPLAQFPFRVNLLSAALAALVCVLLSAFLRHKLGVSPRLAVLFSLFWIVGATTYPAALSAKTGIYQLSALFLLGILWALFEGRLGPAFFLFGLSLANHWMTMLTFLPGVGVFLYYHSREKHLERKQIISLISFLLLGLSVYLFLPLRALQNPILNWGDPSTFHHFVFDFLRSQYADQDSGGGLVGRFGQFWVYLKTAFDEFGGLLLVALGGAVLVYPKDKTRVKALGALWLGLVGVVCFYLGLPEDRLYLIPNFVMPAHLFILLFAAWGLEIALAKWGTVLRPKAEKILISLLVLWLVVLGALRFSSERQTDYTYSYDFVLNSFKAVPRNALYFCKGDAVVFPCWYFQWVEHRRTDLAVVGVDGLPMDWVRKNLAEFHPGLGVPRTLQPVGVESIPTLAKWIVEQNKLRELYFSYNQTEAMLLPGTKIVPYGLSSKGFSPGEEPVLDEAKDSFIWQGMRYRHLNDSSFPVDRRTHELTVRDYGVFRNSLGVYYEDLGDGAKAKLTSRSKAADLLKINEDYQKSFDNFQWAQQWAPDDAQFAYNLGNASFHVGRVADSLGWYEKATQLNSRYTVAYFNWAVAALQMGKYSKAKECFSKVLELQPDNAEAKRGLEYLTKIGQ